MLLRIASVLLIVCSIALAWLVMDVRNFLNTPFDFGGDGVRYIIKPNDTVHSIAKSLKTRGILNEPYYLIGLAKWNRVAGKIKVGEYQIPRNIKPEVLLNLLVSGDVIQHSLTLIEGWTFAEVMNTVNDNQHLTHTLNDYSVAEIMDRLGLMGQHPEGRFYPDTYHFTQGTTDLEFLKRCYRQMESILATEWQGRSKNIPLKSAYEALILASIIERETNVDAERAQVAGVFTRRLQRNMRLQTDPTVIYGLGKEFDGNIRRKDLRRDTPYNTYVHKGLPPTPIAMPSAKSIHAALHPDKGKSIYFVAKGDGAHYFSDTLQEHNDAVRKYQLGGKR
ncbi:MAG: aminodeoxychorismate lyase [Gammaproteobacteria bacterium]|nr:endolytic transglycosylase MltG [Gammaproteobacteria bacterium]PCH62270.1 MAG: aminodeoxychorismate lyase [Gammaproteobacteria bacterium]